MGLIGSEYPIDSEHPRELVEALYSEVFDEYPADWEVDVALLATHPESGGGPLNILDYVVFRTSDPDGNNDFLFSSRPLTSNGVFVENIKNVSIWARDRFAELGIAVPALGASMFIIHKHPEGLNPTGKDSAFIDLFNSFDVILTESQRADDEQDASIRVFSLFAVVNRDKSWPGNIPNGAPRPTGSFDVDFGVIDVIMARATPEALKEGWATEEQAARVAELADLARPLAAEYEASDDEDIRDAILEAAKPLFFELLTLWQEFSAKRELAMSNPASMLDALHAAGLHELADAMERLMGSGEMRPVDVPEPLGGGLGFAIPIGKIPEPMAAEPMDVDLDKLADALREPQAKPSSIFDLPDIDDLDEDDPEVRWN